MQFKGISPDRNQCLLPQSTSWEHSVFYTHCIAIDVRCSIFVKIQNHNQFSKFVNVRLFVILYKTQGMFRRCG